MRHKVSKRRVGFLTNYTGRKKAKLTYLKTFLVHVKKNNFTYNSKAVFTQVYVNIWLELYIELRVRKCTELSSHFDHRPLKITNDQNKKPLELQMSHFWKTQF